MSYALTVIRSEDVQSFCARNGGTTVSRNASEVWAGYLAANGGTGLRLPELEATWLSTHGAIGNNLRDLWGSYVNQLGYTGDFRQQMYGFFATAAPDTLPIGSPFDNILIESGFDFLLENGDALLMESVTQSALEIEAGGALLLDGVGLGTDDALVLE